MGRSVLRPYTARNYQASFSANWNVRGSRDAVGCPALQVPEVGSQRGLTSPTLKRLSMLKPSAITSRLRRSVMGNLRAMRRSIWKKPGRLKALRPSVPVQPTGGVGIAGLTGMGLSDESRHTVGIVKSTLFTNVESTTGRPAGTRPLGNASGRFVAVPRSRLVSKPIRIL